MKTNILRWIFGFWMISMLCTSCKSSGVPKTERKKEFVILNTGDTIYGKKIKNTKWFNKLGRITVVKKNKEELVYGYDEVYQLHFFNRKGKESVYELVKEYKHIENSYQTMDVVINKGKVKFYYHDPGELADRPFIVSDIFYGYAHKRSYKKFLKQLDKCEAFRKKFTQKKERRKRFIRELVLFYNSNCGSLN